MVKGKKEWRRCAPYAYACAYVHLACTRSRWRGKRGALCFEHLYWLISFVVVPVVSDFYSSLPWYAHALLRLWVWCQG